MPYVEEPNYQLCTFKQAQELANKLNAVGVKVETIFEIGGDGVRVDTTSDQYVDSGTMNQYVAKIWGGPEQSLAITNAMFERDGYNWTTFTKLATAAQRLPPDSAILALKGVLEAANRNLEREMK